MKFSCLQENLNKGLSIVSRFISTRPQLPVLSNILLIAKKDNLSLKATNLESGITYKVGVKIEEEGEITIPAKTLSELVSQLPADKVDFLLEENNLKINCQRFQARIAGLPATEFPPLPESSGKPNLSFKTEEISAPVSQVSFAAAQDESRPVLSGVRIFNQDKGLTLVATDGFRLSVVGLPTVVSAQPIDLLLPSRTLIEVVRILAEEGEKEFGLEITKETNQAVFSLGRADIVCRLLEGQFPNYEKIIPHGFNTHIVVNKDELAAAIKTAAIFAREAANIIKFEIHPSASSGPKFQISANAPQVGENTVELEAKVEGENAEIAFNCRFLQDLLGIVSSEDIIFEMTSSLSPGVFKIAGNANFLHLIMPVRVNPEG